jgi:integrase
MGELEKEKQLDDAAQRLGLDRTTAEKIARPPTLREFFERRWVEHAKVVQNKTTRAKSQSPFKYLIYYLGDHHLDELLEPAVINSFVEKMKASGSISFAKRKDGQSWRGGAQELSNATINKGLQRLRALLNLAHAEKVIATKPKIDLLPEDDSVAVVAPSDEQFQALLDACADYVEVAPLMREVIEFTAETGLRRGEVFALTFHSVDLARNCIRIETQRRARMVNGKAWKPKHNKFREVPLSTRARQIIDQRVKDGPPGPHDQVFPNKGGAPYHAMDYADDVEGKGFFWDVVEAASVKGVVTFHALRHLFAVRLLTRGVPITVVSELLGHSDINLTVKRYGRFASDAKVKWEAVKVLDKSC